MTTRRENMADLLADGFRTILFDRWDTIKWIYDKIFNVDTSTKKEEKDSAVHGFGLMPSKAEGMGITYEDPAQGYDVTYTHVTYGMGFRVTEEMWEDDLYGKIKKLPKALAKSAMHTVEQACANIFNNGFVTTYNSGGDSKALFATDHPLVGGGTQANTPAVAADLTVSSLQAAITAIEEMTDDNGIVLTLKPKTLLVPTALKWTAKELLKSEKKPGTADNDINALADEDLGYTTWPYLTDDDAWFLLTEKDEHELNFFWRRKLDTDDESDFDTGDLKFKATMRFSVKWSDYRGTYGSPGA